MTNSWRKIEFDITLTFPSPGKENIITDALRNVCPLIFHSKFLKWQYNLLQRSSTTLRKRSFTDQVSTDMLMTRQLCRSVPTKCICTIVPAGINNISGGLLRSIQSLYPQAESTVLCSGPLSKVSQQASEYAKDVRSHRHSSISSWKE